MNAFEQVASPGQSLREVKTILRYKCQSNLFHSQQAVPRPKQMANKFSPGPDNSKEQDQGQTAEQHADVAFFADDHPATRRVRIGGKTEQRAARISRSGTEAPCAR